MLSLPPACHQQYHGLRSHQLSNLDALASSLTGVRGAYNYTMLALPRLRVLVLPRVDCYAFESTLEKSGSVYMYNLTLILND